MAKTPKDRIIDQGNKILWTDESNFEILGSNGRVYVRRRLGERTASSLITPTVKPVM